MIPADLQFLLPSARYLFLALILFACLFGYLAFYRSRVLRHYAEKKLLASLVSSASQLQRLIQYSCLCLAWAGAVFALMQPVGSGHYLPGEVVQRQQETQQVIFLLDTSASMEVADTRVGSTRLAYAKEIIAETMTQLDGQMVSLYLFTSEVTPLVPPTYDYLYSQLLLDRVKRNGGGTDLRGALAFIRQQLLIEPEDEDKVLVLLSDGEDTANNSEKAIIDVLNEIKELQFLPIGMGSRQGGVVPGVLERGEPVVSTLREGLLRKIGAEGKGEFFLANASTSHELAAQVVSFLKQQKKVTKRKKATKVGKLVYDFYFQVPLLFAIFSLAFALLLPERRILRKK